MRFRFAGCVVDEESREIRRGGEKVHLTPKAFQLLQLLLHERPRAVSKQEIHEALWPDTFVADSNLPSLIKEIRSAISDEGARREPIRTVHGHGYAFSGAAEEVRQTDDSVRSIIFFPLECDGEDTAIRSLGDGLIDSLINFFSRSSGFRVAPRSTSYAFRSIAADPHMVRRKLDCRWIVSGRIEHSAGWTQVQIELTDTSTGAQSWGKQFRCDESAVASLGREIAADLYVTLAGQLPAELPGVWSETPTEDSAAYMAFLRGRFHWNQRNASSLTKAIASFNEAVSIDPGYASAHVALADVYVAIGSRELVDPRIAFERAAAHAARGLELDPLLAEAHSALGAIAEVLHWEWDEAEARYSRAIALKPDSPTAMQWYALHLGRRRRHDEARNVIERAVGLDPLSLIINTNRGLIAYLRRDFIAANQIFESVLDLDATFDGALIGKAMSLDLLGDAAGAMALYRQLSAVASVAPLSLGLLAHALTHAGDRSGADAAISQLLAMKSQRYVSPVWFALPLIAAGACELALDHLELAVKERSAWCVYLVTEPRLDPLRELPRYQRLCKAVRLSPDIA